MTINEAKEIIERKQSNRVQEADKLLHHISTIISMRESGKITLFEALKRIKEKMEEIEEARQDYNEYWRVLDTLDWFE